MFQVVEREMQSVTKGLSEARERINHVAFDVRPILKDLDARIAELYEFDGRKELLADLKYVNGQDGGLIGLK
eukprot:9282618-Alexandrium_andersonii.AAC.1